MNCKKLFCLLLAFVMLLGLLPTVSAAPLHSRQICTVTFDGNLTDDTYESVEVPSGTVLTAEQIPVLENRDGWVFAGWGDTPWERRCERADLSEPIEFDRTLYAIWEEDVEEVDLYIRTPAAGEYAGTVQADTHGWFSKCEIVSESDSYPNGCWWDDASKIGNYGKAYLFDGEFEAGRTYYGMLLLRPYQYGRFSLSKNTQFHLYGGAELYTRSIWDDPEDAVNSVRLYFSVTIPERTEIDELELFVERINPNTSVDNELTTLCLTGGAESEPIDCWWDNAEDVNENYETVLSGENARFEQGKTYYSFFQIFPSDESVTIAEEPSITIHGGTVERVVRYGGSDLLVIYSVQVPEVCPLTVYAQTLPFGEENGGAFYADDERAWQMMIDGPNVETGWRSFTAKARRGYYFDGWYDMTDETGEDAAGVLLTRKPTLEILHDSMRSIVCRFRRGEGSDLFVCGVPVTAANAEDVLGDGVFSYDPAAKTLTVNGNCEYAGCILYSKADGLTVRVSGDSLLRNPEAESSDPVIELSAGTTVIGPGQLRVECEGSMGAFSVVPGGALTFLNANVSAETASYAIMGDYGTELTVINSSVSLLARPEKAMAIAFFDRLTLQDCEIITPKGAIVDGGSVFKADHTPAHEVVIGQKLSPPSGFSDVPEGEYFSLPVAWAVSHDPQITNGTGDGKFSPNDTCTRGQVVTFLWRANGCPEPAADRSSVQNPFKDVKDTDYFYKAVLWAKEKGITTGTDATHFSPNDGCTRGQVVTFLWRAEGSPEASTPGENELPIQPAESFDDVPADAYYYKAVLWAVAKGVTNGTDPGKFSPEDTCTRGQIVTFLYRDMA